MHVVVELNFFKNWGKQSQKLDMLTKGYKIIYMFWNTKELEGKKKYARDLQKVADEPAMGQTDVDELNKQVRES